MAWPALKLYLEGLGGPFFWTAFLTITASGILSELVATWWLGVWSRAYDTENHVSVAYYLSGYIFILVASVLLVFGAKISFVLAGIRASRKIHAKLLDSILSTTLRWLDV